MKYLKIIFPILCLSFITGCSCNNKEETETIQETTIKEETTEEETIEIPIELETKKDEKGNDIYINLETVPEDKIDENGNIKVSDEDGKKAIDEGIVSLYNTTDKQKAFDYKLPKNYEYVDLFEDSFVIKNKDTEVPFMVTILDGTKEDNYEKQLKEFEKNTNYLTSYNFDIKKEVNLGGFNCLILRERFLAKTGDELEELTLYCYADYLGNTIKIQMAENEEYINPEFDEDFKYTRKQEEALMNAEETEKYYKEILSGIYYNK